MKWLEFRVHTTNEAIEPISNILHENGASGIAIEDSAELVKEHSDKFGEIFELNPDDYPETGVYIKAYLSEEAATDENIAEIKRLIDRLSTFDIPIEPNETSLREVKEESWATAWKQYYKPIHITDQITIVPEWEKYNKRHPEEVVVWLDPGMAFGTGLHATTALSIRNIANYIEPNMTVFDVGCGSGILSITSAKLGAEKVYAFDLDDVAVESSKQNIALNKLGAPIVVAQNNLLEGIDLQADLIVANILAEVILKLGADAYRCLPTGGFFITSGIIAAKEALVVDHLKETGFIIIQTLYEDDWVSIVAQK